MRSDARYFPRRSAITGDVERARADPATLARFPRLRDATPHVVTLRAGESSWALLLLLCTDSSPLLSRSEMGQRVASGSAWCLLHQKKRIRTIRFDGRRWNSLPPGEWILLPANWWHAIRTLDEESHSWSVVVDAPEEGDA